MKNRLLRFGQISWLIAVFAFMGQYARAATITFNDLTDRLTITTDAPQRVTDNGCETTSTRERCNAIDHNPYLNGSIIGGDDDLPDYVLIYEGATTNTGLSDWISRIDVSPASVSLIFTSDGTSERPLPLPSGLGNNPKLTGCFDRVIIVNKASVRCMMETGLAQTAGTITFRRANGATTVDTVKFYSDPVPEPGSLLLLGTGLVAGGRCWRKRQRRALGLSGNS